MQIASIIALHRMLKGENGRQAMRRERKQYMRKHFWITSLGLVFGGLMVAAVSFAETVQTTTTTAPPPATSTTSTTTVKTAPPATTTSTTTTGPAVVVPGAQPAATTSGAPRAVLDQEALEKMGDAVCAPGFDAFVGNQNKNVCRSWANAPDIAYSCVWDKEGPPAYSATAQGPCKLDYTENRGSVVITKQQYKSNPPLDYGKTAYCCYRSSTGPTVSSTTTVITK